MRWIFLTIVLAAIAAVIFWRFRRRWVEPWRDLEELVTAIVARKPPRKFLMTANARANVLGLELEKLATNQMDLERTASHGAQSLDSVFGALPDGVALIDNQQRIRLTNPRFRELFGLREESAGATLLEIVRDTVVDRAVKHALDRGEPRTEPTTVARGLEARRELEVTAVPFASGNNGTQHAVVLFRDVTQVRAVEEMRRDFVANVSHELRTPLSIFRGYVETLLDDPQQSRDEMIRILEVMDRQAERLTLLVEDILSLAQLETAGARLDYSEIFLPDFLGDILRDWEKRFSTKLLHASLEVPEEFLALSADEHRLQEVIYNLLDNAVKYSQPEGSIVLRAEAVGDLVRISVQDKGVGVPANDLPRIFERFYRADKARSRQLGGTGLGLSIVKHIVQLHGGHVEAESEVGRGTKITVVLPRRAPATSGVTES